MANSTDPIAENSLGTVDSAKEKIAGLKKESQGVPKLKYVIRLKIGEKIFSNLQGDILKTPYVYKCTERHSSAKIMLNDPDDKIRKSLPESGGAEIEAGFVTPVGEVSFVKNIFKGKIWGIARRPPDGLEIEIVDEAMSLSNNITSGIFPGDELGAIAGEQAGLNMMQSPSYQPLDKAGWVVMGQSELRALERNMLLQGQRNINRGSTVHQRLVVDSEPSGIVLDYQKNRPAFMGRPKIEQKSSLQQQSGYGGVTVKGFDITNKEPIGHTVYTPKPAPKSSSGVLSLPEGDELKLDEPLFQGSPYNWGHVTQGGTRKPDAIARQRAIAIAQAITPYTIATVGTGQTWDIYSWYQDPQLVRRVGLNPNTRHLVGDAVDISFPNVVGFWEKEVKGKWNGGHAFSGDFIHLDLGAKRTWRY